MQRVKVGDLVRVDFSWGPRTGRVVLVTPPFASVDLGDTDGSLYSCNFDILHLIATAEELAATSINSPPQQQQQQQLSFNLDATWNGIGFSDLPIGIQNRPEPVSSQTETWKAEGRCPTCGELGHFDRSFSMICKTHGAY